MENTLQSRSDDELMLGYKNGDLKAFVTLVTKYKDRILNYIYRYIGDYQQAQDLTQETFFQVHKSAKLYHATGKFSAWLYRIATNLCKDELRRRARHPAVSMDKPISNGKGKISSLAELISGKGEKPDEALVRKELEAHVKEMIDSLPYIYREVVIMRLVQDLSYKEISEISGCSVGTARERMHYALDKIRSEFY